ncbi:MAG: hydrolase [Planctomycetes bacterium]|nr:hydrolase [Planctomycetota bacterium]
MRHPEILLRERSALLVVDIQEKLVPTLPRYPEIEPNVQRLIRVAGILRVPIVVTEQYPKGLGTTLASIREALPAYQPVVKNTFSCCGSPEVVPALRQSRAEAVVLVGMEAHVCVQQTALDLMANGFRVHVPADAVVSRRKLDWEVALRRMERAGAILTTSQSVIFELLVEAGTPEFKAVLPLMK